MAQRSSRRRAKVKPPRAKEPRCQNMATTSPIWARRSYMDICVLASTSCLHHINIYIYISHVICNILQYRVIGSKAPWIAGAKGKCLALSLWLFPGAKYHVATE